MLIHFEKSTANCSLSKCLKSSLASPAEHSSSVLLLFSTPEAPCRTAVAQRALGVVGAWVCSSHWPAAPGRWPAAPAVPWPGQRGPGYSGDWVKEFWAVQKETVPLHASTASCLCHWKESPTHRSFPLHAIYKPNTIEHISVTGILLCIFKDSCSKAWKTNTFVMVSTLIFWITVTYLGQELYNSETLHRLFTLQHNFTVSGTT